MKYELRGVVLAALACVCGGRITDAQTTQPAEVTSGRPTTEWTDLARPVIEGRWLRPALETAAVPEWGFANGLRVGLAPLPGPRGLLRIYTPYAGQTEPTMINFIAIEPTPTDARDRGLSELEPSAIDHLNGKRFRSADHPGQTGVADASLPARGVIETIDGVEQLSVGIDIERFDNGSHVYLKLRFRADHPHEVGIAVFAYDDSKPLRECVVTATMGNYARLRELQLADRVVSAKRIWPDHQGDTFTPHAGFALSDLLRNADGDAVVSATPNEAEPEKADYESSVRKHWHYAGTPARQWWRMASPPSTLRAQVNGRTMYWASQSPIPGGIAFENFELVTPFEQGQEFWFGVEPLNENR